jgi:hypothetical protein
MIKMQKLAIAIVLMCIGATFLTAIPGVSAKVTPDNCKETDAGVWCAKTLMSASEKFDGVNYGDADNDGKLEVVASGLSGEVWMAKYISKEWTAQVLWSNPGELLQPAVGDVDNDGKNEVIVGGMVAGPEADTGAGQVALIKGSGNHWVGTRIYTDNFMVHGIHFGDFDPDHPGNEIVIGTFGHNMTELAYTDGKWVVTPMMQAGHKVRTVVVGDLDDDGQNEVLGVSKDQNIYIVKKVNHVWTSKIIYTDPIDGPARGGYGDYDGDGITDIVVSGDSTDLALIKRTGNNWSGSVIFEDSDGMRGARIGDAYDGHPGNEIYGAGYSGNVTMHYQVNGAWKHYLLFHDIGRLHDLKIGDVDPDHPGNELLTCGYSNRVTIVAQYHPDFSVDMTPSGYDVIEKTEVSFKTTISSKDFYTDNLNVAVEGLPTGATAALSSNALALTTEKAVVTVTISIPSTVANGNTTFTVKVTGTAGTKTATGYLNVKRTVGTTVTALTAAQSVKVGQTVTYNFAVKNTGNLPDTFDLTVSSQNGFVLTSSMSKTPVLQPGANVTVSVTVTMPKTTSIKTDVLTLKATSDFDAKTSDSKTVTTTIKKENKTTNICGGVIWASILMCLGAVGAVGYLRPRRS